MDRCHNSDKIINIVHMSTDKSKSKSYEIIYYDVTKGVLYKMTQNTISGNNCTKTTLHQLLFFKERL